MDWLIIVGVVVVALAGISLLAYLRRIAAAAERIADAQETQGIRTVPADEHRT